MKGQYRARAESDELVYNELVRAARAGEKCPSNSKICALLGVSVDTLVLAEFEVEAWRGYCGILSGSH